MQLEPRCENCLHPRSMHQKIGRKFKRFACFHEDEHGMCPCEEFEVESDIFDAADRAPDTSKS